LALGGNLPATKGSNAARDLTAAVRFLPDFIGLHFLRRKISVILMAKRPRDPAPPEWRLDLFDMPRLMGLNLRLELVLAGIYNNELNILLIDSGRHSALALPGAYLQEDASFEKMMATLLRKLKLAARNPRLLGVFSDPDRDPRNRAIAVAYLAAVDVGQMLDLSVRDKRFEVVRLVQSETGRRLVSRRGKDLLGMIWDHQHILLTGLHDLKQTVDSSMVAFDFLGPAFTMTELRKVHEILLGRELEPVLFRKQMIGRIFPGGRQLVKVGEQRLTGGRPAELYKLGLAQIARAPR
jgi:8-oxo-dGTP diphosphatase